jgi:hypothetical protein
MSTAMQLGVPMLGQLLLDPELARRCDAGEIEAHTMDAFAPIAEKVLDLASSTPSTPIF